MRGLIEVVIGVKLVLKGARWLNIPVSLEAKRGGGARTKRIPRKRKEEKVRSFTELGIARMNV